MNNLVFEFSKIKKNKEAKKVYIDPKNIDFFSIKEEEVYYISDQIIFDQLNLITNNVVLNTKRYQQPTDSFSFEEFKHQILKLDYIDNLYCSDNLFSLMYIFEIVELFEERMEVVEKMFDDKIIIPTIKLKSNLPRKIINLLSKFIFITNSEIEEFDHDAICFKYSGKKLEVNFSLFRKTNDDKNKLNFLLYYSNTKDFFVNLETIGNNNVLILNAEEESEIVDCFVENLPSEKKCKKYIYIPRKSILCTNKLFNSKIVCSENEIIINSSMLNNISFPISTFTNNINNYLEILASNIIFESYDVIKNEIDVVKIVNIYNKKYSNEVMCISDLIMPSDLSYFTYFYLLNVLKIDKFLSTSELEIFDEMNFSCYTNNVLKTEIKLARQKIINSLISKYKNENKELLISYECYYKN